MGNICAGPSVPPVKKIVKAKALSDSTFGKDPTLNPADFICSKRTGELFVKSPGSINGQQFIVEDCTNCKIILFYHIGCIQIDNCQDCQIYAGPCSSSLFIRNCSRVELHCSVQQFRTRECSDMDIYLFSSTEPIIEMSSELRIGCLTSSYFSIAEHFDKAKLSVWNNKWNEVIVYTYHG